MDLKKLDFYQENKGFDSKALYRGLGSFWTLLFQERNTLKGYTHALVEEKIQQYLSLVEMVGRYSIKEFPVFDTVRWKPILIYKSKYNQTPFVFARNDTEFGPQSPASPYYEDIIFRFGYSKTPTNSIYLYTLPEAIAATGVICDKIIDPSIILHNGIDIKFKDKIVYFNTNIFEDSNLLKLKIVGENGTPKTYIDSFGQEQEEELIVLWAYNASISKNQLYYNFGHLFNLQIDNSEYTKGILNSLFNIFTDGPTVKNIKTCCAMFMGLPTVIHNTEIIDEVFADLKYKYIVTDKECYRIPKDFTLLPSLDVGSELHIGDTFVSNIQFYDNLTKYKATNYGEMQFSTGWWNNPEIINTGLSFSKYLFNGEYLNQLTFSNSLDVISLDSAGDIVFPVEGHPDDVRTFKNYINDISRKEVIKSKLGLVSPGDIYTTIPLTFIMENFLKTNTSILYISFYAEQDKTKFLSLLKIIKDQLPKYTYLIIKLDITFPADNYNKLNDSIYIEFEEDTLLLNADGSNQEGELAKLAPYDYKDVNQRLFELALSIKKNSTTELDYDYVVTDIGNADEDALLDGRVVLIKEGSLLRPIPPNATTAQYNNLLLLAFN